MNRINKGLSPLLVILLASCAPNNISFQKGASSAQSSISQPPEGGGGGTTLKATEDFLQTNLENDVDVLLVIDNSPSMNPIHDKLGQSFSSFIDSLAPLDWQIGFTTTSLREFQGQLAPLVGRPSGEKILKPTTSKKTQVFYDTVMGFGTGGSGDERGIYSAVNTVQLANSDNSAFFRKKSALAFIFVSDEDERSTGGRNIRHNTNESSGPIETNDLPQTLVDLTYNIFGPDKKMSGYGINVMTGDSNCYNMIPESFDGTFYSLFASLTGGKVGSICADDYNDTLSAIGKNIKELMRSVSLKHQPIPQSVKVTLIPAQPQITFNVKGNKVVFSQTPLEGSRIVVEYQYISP